MFKRKNDNMDEMIINIYSNRVKGKNDVINSRLRSEKNDSIKKIQDNTGVKNHGPHNITIRREFNPISD